MIPTADTMRHHALPYTYVASRHLIARDLSRWPVIVLPGVSCMDHATRTRLREYVAGGGLLVACGETATRDAIGEPVADPFMLDVFGIESQKPCASACQFAQTQEHPAFSNIPWPDEITAQYMGGTNAPVLAFNQAVAIDVATDVQVLGCFSKDAGIAAGMAALTIKPFGKGTAVYCAGITERVFARTEFGTNVLNYAGRVLAHIITLLAKDKLPLRAKGFPPRVPMQELRPMDQRSMPTAEFMPCIGDNLYLATVASYFKEPMTFPIEAILPEGKTCREVRELISNQPINNVRREGNRIEIDVDLGFDDCLKVFAFTLEQESSL